MRSMDDKKDLIHQLYEEMIGITEEEQHSRYIRSTGTLYGDPERFEREKTAKRKETEKEDLWSKLNLNPSDVR